jgi:hypothetical protein
MTTKPGTTNPDYARVPNYDCAVDVAERDVDTLSAAAFRSEYVLRSRPLVIRRGARHFPAFTRWRSLDYLKSTCGSVEVEVHDTPVTEADPLLSSPERRTVLALLRLTSSGTKQSFADFLDAATSAEDLGSGLRFLYSVPISRGGRLGALGGDVAELPFLRGLPPVLFGAYPTRNVYFYRSGVTDHHYHVGAEAVLAQILGTKEVLLLPPSERVWSYMSVVTGKGLHAFQEDLHAYPAARTVVPYRAVLEPGDALYIPVYWWHFVSTRGGTGLGASVPTWWRSPLRMQLDLRFPAARASLRALPGAFTGKRGVAIGVAARALALAVEARNRIPGADVLWPGALE